MMILAVDLTAAGVGYAVVFGLGLLLAAVAANHDRQHLRLPNQLVAGVAVAGMASALITGQIGSSLIAGLIAATPLLLLNILEPSSLGFGDVKFAGAGGVLVGSISLVAAPIFVVASMMLVGVNRAFSSAEARPLGPALFAAFLIAAITATVFRQKEWIS